MIVDISDPTAPTTVGSLHFPGDSHRVAVGGNVAYVAHRSVGLKVIDISNSAAPIELTTYVIADGDVRDVLVAGGLAYVAASEPGCQRSGWSHWVQLFLGRPKSFHSLLWHRTG